MPQPDVYLCSKRGCGTRSDQALLAGELDGVACIEQVRCQSVCEGPVAGVVVDGRIEWFERVRTPKARRAIVALVGRRGAGPLPKPLAKRRRGKRSGKLKR